MANIKDVAALCGKSIATVSRAINNPELVAEPTLSAVQKAISQLQYIPNQTARTLLGIRTSNVGLVINTFGGEYFSRIVEGFDAALEEQGLTGVAVASRMTELGELSAIASLENLRCDAIVVHSNRLPKAKLDELMSKNEKMVIIGCRNDRFPERSIYVDNERAGFMAAKHLYDLGHRQVAQISGHLDYVDTKLRSKGFSDFFSARGISQPADRCFSGRFAEEGGRSALAYLVDKFPEITAVFCHNDEMAWGALQQCANEGIIVPDEMSVIGMDDLPMSGDCAYDLTTIVQPLNRIGYNAGLLAVKLTNPDLDSFTVDNLIDIRLMARGTTGTPVSIQLR